MSDSKERLQYTIIDKVKVPVGALKVGMYVCELDRPWLDTPFKFQGFRLEKPEDIETVRRHCQYVYVDKQRSQVVETPPPQRPQRPAIAMTKAERIPTLAPRRVEVEREIGHAVRTRGQVERVVRGFLENVRKGQSLDLMVANESVAECVESICQNADAMLLLTQLKHRDEYTSEHSMNVCVLSILLGRHLGFPRSGLRYLGLCGLMHDIGKIRVPNTILNKPAKLTLEEDEVMRQHPVFGHEILTSSPGITSEVLEVAYGHHERIDGSGYPRGVYETDLSPFTRIVAIADCYDAITSDRVYKAGLSHMEALSILNRSAGVHFDRAFALNFIECLGVYPAGSIVEMSNGEVALVLEVNPTQKLRPKVLMLLDPDKREQPARIIDLAHFALDPKGQPYRIRWTLRSRAFGLDVSRFLKDGAVHLPGKG